MKKFNAKGIKIGLLGIGSVYLMIGIVQQFFVNDLFKTSVIALAVSLFFILVKRDNKKLRVTFSLMAALNLSGLFYSYFTLLSFLGLTASLLGLVLVGLGLIKCYREQGKAIKKTLLTLSSFLLVFLGSTLSLTTIKPDITMGWLGTNLMGDGVTKFENIEMAEQQESMLANGTRLLSDIQYDKEVANGFLDIYQTTESSSEKKPTLIFMHGGGYSWGDKAGGDPNTSNSSFENTTTANFLAQGYNVVQMNYALAPEYPFPVAIKQLNRGLAYLVAHGEEYGLDMTNVVIGGGSAGGNLAGLLVNIQTNPRYGALLDENAAINPDYIKAVIFESSLLDNSQFGVTGSVLTDWIYTHLGRIYLEINELKTDDKIVTPSNVTEYVTENFPPSFISDGNTGSFGEQAFALNEKLTNLGVDAKLNYYSAEEAILHHGFEESGSEQAKETFKNMFDFLSRYVEK